jgi:CMP-N-acetylneuraminic acid synthetase
MYLGHKIIATICARGGSKGVPGKNIKILSGKPLLVYSIDSARKCPLIDRIIVSTDDHKIKTVAVEAGLEVPFLRPKHLATDKSGRVPAVIHAVKKAELHWSEEYDIIVDLGNVAPLRTAADIGACIRQLVDNPQTNIVVSVSESHRNPYLNMLEVRPDGYARVVKSAHPPFQCRQDAPAVYDMNDAVFAVWKNKLFQRKSFILPRRAVYVMPAERSIDIDKPIDFAIAKFLIEHQV